MRKAEDGHTVFPGVNFVCHIKNRIQIQVFTVSRKMSVDIEEERIFTSEEPNADSLLRLRFPEKKIFVVNNTRIIARNTCPRRDIQSPVKGVL